MGTPRKTPETADERLRLALEIEGLSVRGTYRIDEVQRLLRISEMTVRRKIEEGTLKKVSARRGSFTRIDYGSLLALFEDNDD